MSSTSVQMQAPVTTSIRTTATARTVALAALAIGTVSSIAFACIAVLMTVSNETAKDLSFHHTGDYWYTGIGIPTALSCIALLFAVRALQRNVRPRLTMAGCVVNAVALCLLTVMLAVSLATGSEARWGGMYIVATLATFVGHSLFAAGSWRVGLVPRPMLAVWPLVWLIGAFAAQGATPVILAAFYAGIGVLVARRA